jgi:hypothetical protein
VPLLHDTAHLNAADPDVAGPTPTHRHRPDRGRLTMPNHTHTDRGRGHAPTVALDLTGPAGAAIVELFRALKDMGESDGSWPGADVVGYLSGTWLPGLGINPDGPADTLTATPAAPVCAHRRVNVEFSTTVYAVVQHRDGADQEAGYELVDVVVCDQAISERPISPLFCMDCNRWLQTGDEAAQDAIECVAGPLANWPAGRIGSL